MIGTALSSRALGDAGLRDLASEWGAGNRPAAAGSRSGGRQRAARDSRTMQPQR